MFILAKRNNVLYLQNVQFEFLASFASLLHAVKTCRVATALKKVAMITSTHMCRYRLYDKKIVIFCRLE